MTELLNTRQAADALGVTPSRLQRALWDGRVDEPQRGPGNTRLWTPQDLDRASWQLLGKPLEVQP
jgi:DNA-binding transcriptional MerR regulator